MKILILLLSTFFITSYSWAQSGMDYLFAGERSEVIYNNSGEKHIEGFLSLFEIQTGETIEFQYDYYAPTPTPGKQKGDKLVIITPTIEGATPLEYFLKDYLQNRGFHVLIPRSLPLVFTYDDTTVLQFERASIRARVGTTSIVNHLARTESFDEKSIGLLGASLGGIRSSILFGLDPRFRAMFIAVAGADFPSIYATSENSVLKPIRGEHMDYLGLSSQKSYENFLRGKLILDPYMVTKSSYLANVAMVIADDDKIVPTYNQWQLWSAIKAAGIHPKTYISDSGHVQGALHLIRYRNNIVEWFKERL